MKICIPCASNGAKAQVLEGNIGTAPYFAVYESNTGNYGFKGNLNIIDRDSRCNPAGAVLSLNVGAILCRDICDRTAQLLSKSGIMVLMTARTKVEDVIKAYEAGEYFERKIEPDTEKACIKA